MALWVVGMQVVSYLEGKMVKSGIVAVQLKVRSVGLYEHTLIFLERVRMVSRWKQNTRRQYRKTPECEGRPPSQSAEDKACNPDFRDTDLYSTPVIPRYNFMSGTTSSNIRLIGSIESRHPGRYKFDQSRIEQILALLPHLHVIDDRDPRSM